ncbi:MAG: F0F1 ATP synthase subunit epsilon [Ignavibacteria bacterium]|nr:F0F1 ATP synthase subunit epsilon [Ignavibacteria bacterium]
MKLFTLEIVTPSKLAFTAEVVSVTVPGSLGEFQVLYNHAPIVSNLEIGKMKVQTKDGDTLHFAISGGVIEVLKNKVVVLAQSLERSDEIDTERARQAVERAKQRLEQRDQIDVARAEAALTRGMNRLKVSSLR